MLGHEVVFRSSCKVHEFLISGRQNGGMLQDTIEGATAPCPKCRKGMILAATTPSPGGQLARHTYLCDACNQTKTYVLPIGHAAAPADGSGESDSYTMPGHQSRRQESRETLAAPATIYDKDGNFLAPCTVRDLSKSGARLELFKEAALPRFFHLSLLPDGGGRRLCSKMWQLTLIAGVRFVEKQGS